MTGKQIDLVKASFAKVEPVAEEAAVLFYAKLFDLDPDLRRLFTTDIKEQGHKLMQMLEMAVKSLDNLEKIVPAVRASGARHKSYGVKESHYETVAEALLWTLELALEKDFTAETREAWAAVYVLLAQTMKEGGRQPIENVASH